MQITLNFSQEHLQTLNKALIELPYREAAPLISEINRQIADQQKHDSKAQVEQKDAR